MAAFPEFWAIAFVLPIHFGFGMEVVSLRECRRGPEGHKTFGGSK